MMKGSLAKGLMGFVGAVAVLVLVPYASASTITFGYDTNTSGSHASMLFNATNKTLVLTQPTTVTFTADSTSNSWSPADFSMTVDNVTSAGGFGLYKGYSIDGHLYFGTGNDNVTPSQDLLTVDFTGALLMVYNDTTVQSFSWSTSAGGTGNFTAGSALNTAMGGPVALTGNSFGFTTSNPSSSSDGLGFDTSFSAAATAAPVPEPASMVLIGLGSLMLLARVRRRRAMA